MVPVDPGEPQCCATGKCCSANAAGSGEEHFAAEKAWLEIEAMSVAPREESLAFNKAAAGLAVDGSQVEPEICRTASGVAPAELRRGLVFYGNSTEFARCHEAAARLLEMRRRGGSYTWKLSDIALTDSQRRSYADVLMDYRRACFAAPQSDIARSVLSEESINQILRSAGTIIGGDGKPFCGGAIVGNRLFTARHCLLGQRQFTGGSLAVKLGTGWKFVVFAAPDQPIDLSQAEVPQDQRFFGPGVESDWVSLILPAGALPFSGERITVRQAQPWDDLIFISHNRHAAEVLELRRRLGDKTEGLVEQIREPSLDVSPLCRAAIIDGRLMYHACQTEITTSGSPFFTLDKDGKLALVAVQSRPAAGFAPRCERMQNLAGYYPNIAVVLPEAVGGR
ncbi:hypothetical protein [Pelagibius marinus]|uniref:hypothetical protein n=1 Tax=Pelagibius marinus TaxID=2762760 RepID=UPI001872FA4D|nr:hypothetical protein [Pelagibius marinus]